MPDSAVNVREYLEALIHTVEKQLVREAASIRELIAAEARITAATFVTFRVLIDSQADKVALALAASKEAIGKAENSIEARLKLLNELRTDVASIQQLEALEKRLNEQAVRLEKFEGIQQGGQASIVESRSRQLAMLSLMGFAITVVVFVANYITSK